MSSRSAFLSRLSALEQRVLPPSPVVVPSAVELMTTAVGEPDPWQVQVLTSRSPRMLLNCCRQSGKSQTVACLALHTALTTSASLTLLVSPSLRQSMELFRKVAQAFSALGQPMPLEAETKLAYELANGSRLIALPGTEQTIRGYSGVDLLIIDEAARVNDELYYACKPFMAVSQGRTLCLSTPWGKRGWWFREWSEGENWQCILVPAMQCPRIPLQFLAEEQRTLPALWFRSEYCCEFVDVTDQVFGSDLVHAALADDIAPLFAGDAGGLSLWV